MMSFNALTMELFLRLLLARAGGEATFEADSDEIQMSDTLVLFAEMTESGRGVKLSVARVDEQNAGHA
jgi:hypothetical protein